jgi:hypothetical protein
VCHLCGSGPQVYESIQGKEKARRKGTNTMYEIVNKKDGSRLSHTVGGEMMGTTLFKTIQDADKWFTEEELNFDEFEIRSSQ